MVTREPSAGVPRALLVTGGLLLLAIAAIGWLYLWNQQKQMRRVVENELSAVADLKVQQITQWYKVWQVDAHLISGSPFTARNVAHFLANSADRELQANLITWMNLRREQVGYERVLLVDANRQLRLCEPPENNWLGTNAQRGMDEVFATRRPFVSDLHRSTRTGRVNLDIWAPVFAPGGDSINAIFLLEVNIEDLFFPLVQTWPTPSRTAESLMVRREGDEVLYLNELRHRTNTALRLRLPISRDPHLPAAMAALGHEGLVEGRDYRGVPVLAAIRDVPGTPWFLVAKVDQAEVYAPLREKAVGAGLTVGALLLAAVMGIGLFWRRRDNLWLRRQLALEQERQTMSEQVRQVLQDANAQLERRVSERTSDLEAAVRELEAFSYSVSHDLRAPLRSIDGFSLALLEDCGDQLNDEGRRHLERVRAATQRMGQLIDDLLNLSRLSRVELQPAQIDLSAMAREIFAELAQAEPGRVVETVVAGGLSTRGDPRLIRVALQNLLANAWKFTSRSANARIEVGQMNTPRGLAFFVRDNGAGFDMAYADKLFGAFQRLHTQADFPGTGIGLAIVHRVLRRHGGAVWAESAPERGATFYFKL